MTNISKIKLRPHVLFLLIIALSPFIGYGQFKSHINKTIKGENVQFEGVIHPIPTQKNTRSFPATNYTGKKLFPALANETDLRITHRSIDNSSLWIEGRSRNVHARNSNDWKVKAHDYMQEVEKSIALPADIYNYNVVNVQQDKIGQTHVKIQQTYKGIPIYSAEAYLHGINEIDRLNGKLISGNLTLDTQPSLSDEAIHKSVINDVPNYQPDFADPYKLFTHAKEISELVVYPDTEGYKLAYHVTIHNNLIDRWEYFIDAHTGDIIHKHQSICKFHNHDLPTNNSTTFAAGPSVANANDLFNLPQSINTYNVGDGFYMIDASRTMHRADVSNMPNEPVGVIWTIDAFNTSPENEDFSYDHVFSGDNKWSEQKTGVSAHVNAGKAYEYFKNTHGRESINGNGGNIISLINITDADGQEMENAFWNGSAMFYGNGKDAFLPLARGLDVAAHELSHGVVQNTANLSYQGESGALNESFADIFGAMVDRDDWLIGEDVVRSAAFPSGALRNLQNPHNGAAVGDYGNGFQPKHVSEQYTGNQDNGGVHINSGIPNHAFYLFASAVGKQKAEDIFYRALSKYLVKSSQFIDLRLAVIQAAKDLDANNDGAEEIAAVNAFDQVGITEGKGGNYQEDVEVNLGNQFLLTTSADRQNLNLYSADLHLLATVFNEGVISRPSITDDGSAVIFVGEDKNIHLILFDWSASTYETSILEESGIWRNAIVSKDGGRVAALFDELNPQVWVYDYTTQTSNTFELFNPTFTEGITTGDVQYADAMEFDFSGNYIMYDALSSIPSANSDPIEYWDIGFLKIWNEEADTWTLGSIEKLFTALPEGISVGNPTFSKNSPYIISFDQVIEEDYLLMGANIETGELNTLVNNSTVNYPNFSVDDTKITLDANFGTFSLFTIDVDESKINFVQDSDRKILDNARWGIWFANGERALDTPTDDLQRIPLLVAYPNPTDGLMHIQYEANSRSNTTIEVYGMDGISLLQQKYQSVQGINKSVIEVNDLIPGTYMLRVRSGNQIGSKLFIKK